MNKKNNFYLKYINITIKITLLCILCIYNHFHLLEQTKYVPIKIKNNPNQVFYFNFYFFNRDSVITVIAELTQFTMTGPRLKGV